MTNVFLYELKIYLLYLRNEYTIIFFSMHCKVDMFGFALKQFAKKIFDGEIEVIEYQLGYSRDFLF